MLSGFSRKLSPGFFVHLGITPGLSYVIDLCRNSDITMLILKVLIYFMVKQ